MSTPIHSDLPHSRKTAAAAPTADFHSMLRVVLEKSWLIAICLILSGVAAVLYVRRAPRLYEATATVQVEQEDAKVVKVEQVVSEDMHSQEILNTVVQKLCTPSLLEEVLDENKLLPPPATTNSGDMSNGQREGMFGQFASGVKASLRRNTRLIDITVRNTDPRLTAIVANALVEDYLKQDALLQQTATTGASVFLQQEAERLKKKLEASDQALQDYRKQVGSVSLMDSQNIITPQLLDLNKRLTQSTAELIQAQGAYQDSLKMGTNIEELLAYPPIKTDPDVVQISTDLGRLENEFAVVKQRYLAKHPKYILAKSSLEGLREQLAATVLRVRARIQESNRIAQDNAMTAKQGLEKQLQEISGTALQLSDSAVRFNVLSREVQSDQTLYDSIITRLGEMTVAKQIAPERIRMIQAAVVPKSPASPRIKMIYAVMLLGGLVFGLAISFLLNAINTSFRTVDEAEHALGLPVMGAIPRLPKAGKPGNQFAAANMSSAGGAEYFRSLRSTLSLLGPGQDRKVFLFTSSLPGEGKTFTSVNYAISLAQQGLRTLLVDFDLRKPMVEEFLGGKSGQLPGLTDYLLGRKQLSELSQPVKDLDKMSWIPAGRSVPNPAELLAQADFNHFLKEALTLYDRVVIDTAPILPVTDTLHLANKVQTVVLVIQGYKTPRKAVERSVRLLNDASAPIGGIVLNLLPLRRLPGRYYPHHYGYGYAAYGDKAAQHSTADV